MLQVCENQGKQYYLKLKIKAHKKKNIQLT